MQIHLAEYHPNLAQTLEKFYKLEELYICTRDDQLSHNEITTFKDLLKSYKKMENLELDLDFNVTSMISEMRSLKVLQFHNNLIHTFINLLEMCDDRQLGFEIKPGYIAKLSLA